MRSDVNLAVQLSAVVCGVLLRLLTPGWLLIIFFVLVPVCSVALIAQLVLACVALPRRRLTTGVSLGFGLLAASLLGVAALVPDGGDAESSIHSPVGLLSGREIDALSPIAMLLAIAWCGALVWTTVGLVVTRPRPVPGGRGPLAPLVHGAAGAVAQVRGHQRREVGGGEECPGGGRLRRHGRPGPLGRPSVIRAARDPGDQRHVQAA